MAEELFKDGKLSGSGEYVDGERQGRWKFYYRNGQVKADVGDSAGQLDGDCIWYREGGGLLQKGAFRDGQQDGFWQRWHSTGELLDEGTYDVGRKVGEWVTSAPDGSETTRKTFK